MNANDTEQAEHELAHAHFWTGLTGAQRAATETIIRAYAGDIDNTFVGFLGIYMALSRIIPRDRVVYDVGCAYGFGAFFFQKHRRYVGICPSVPLTHRFPVGNGDHFLGTLADWSALYRPDPLHFAIHSYVPGACKEVRSVFDDLFTYYPRGATSCPEMFL